MAFRNIPIKRKLTTLFLISSGAVLLLTSAAYFTYEFVTFRATTRGQLSTLGQILAANSTAALAFGNERDAGETLAALKAEPHVVAAGLYDKDGRLFARYPATLSRDALPARPDRDGYRFEQSALVGFEPVAEEHNKRLGTLFIKSDLGVMSERLRLYGVIVIGVAAVSLFVAFLVSTVFQRQISEPILALAGTAHAIADRGDYSVRATKRSGDELGLLTDAFNQMLTRIDEQDRTLKEGDERLNLALMASGTGTWTWDITNDISTWDDFMYPLFGLTPKAFSGRREDFLGLLHPDDRAAVSQAASDAWTRDEPYDVHYRIVRPDGSERIIASRGKVVRRDAAGAPKQMTGVCWDVTDQKRADELRQRLAAIIDSADDAIIGKSLAGIVDSWNPGAERLFGYRAGEIVGKPVALLIPEDRLDEESIIIERLKRSEQVEAFESVRRSKDGRLVPVSLRVSPIKDDRGRIAGASTIVRDITEQKRAEERLRTLLTELARSNKELEQFAYVASHDLQEPLRMVSSYTQLLERRYRDKLDDDAREFINYAVDGARRMQRLINDLLEFSRVSTRGKRVEPVDANEVLGAVRANLSASIDEAGALVTSEELPTVVADPTQLGQLLQNLIGNAIKFRGAAPPQVHIAACDRPGEWIFSVKDNGIGIAPEYFDRIFVIFQRLHMAAEYPGTGIGLAVCKRIVERHGGRIWVESEPGSGAAFFFSIPKPSGA